MASAPVPPHHTRYGQTKYFYVMDFLFSPRHGCPAAIHERFDLKGSWVDRHAAPGTQPLKDGDWSAARHLSICDESKLALLAQARHSPRSLTTRTTRT